MAVIQEAGNATRKLIENTDVSINLNAIPTESIMQWANSLGWVFWILVIFFFTILFVIILWISHKYDIIEGNFRNAMVVGAGWFFVFVVILSLWVWIEATDYKPIEPFLNWVWEKLPWT